jgi:hypothetical protein
MTGPHLISLTLSTLLSTPTRPPEHLEHARVTAGRCSRGSSDNGSRSSASDAIAEIHAGYVVAGTAFKVVLRAAFGIDEIVSGTAEQRVTPGPPSGREVRSFRTFCKPLT